VMAAEQAPSGTIKLTSKSVAVGIGVTWGDGTLTFGGKSYPFSVEGLSVIAVQNPLSALGDDVDGVARVIKRQPGPVVLVGHGYGGTVITQAGDHSNVAALVYIAACAPDTVPVLTDDHDDGINRPLPSVSGETDVAAAV